MPPGSGAGRDIAGQLRLAPVTAAILGPPSVAVAGDEVEELPAQRLVTLLPASAALVKLLLRQRIGGEPLVIDVVGPDLDVCIADQAAAVAGHGLGDQEVAVR